MDHMKKRVPVILFFVFFLGSLKFFAWGTTFFGEVPTGLLELKDYKHPVYLFVPPTYKAGREYPLLVTVPGEGESPEEQIQFWLSEAKRKSIIVMAPSNLWPEDLPYKMDEWILRIKKDLADRYRISPQKIYLVGKDSGAHYASYLGVNYPDEFTAVATLGGSWIGKFEKLMRLQKTPRKQLPFFVALRKDQGHLLEATKQRAYQFEKKGYPVYFTQLGEDEDFSTRKFKLDLLAWLEENSGVWHEVVEKSKKTFKQKLFIALEELIHL
ncbi:MAG: hypothetical protein NC930_05035 [Candidatus Omnitrophica bacterium]|nr:hypothetical protein [Candidatus Omnitrophota bacterium]